MAKQLYQGTNYGSASGYFRRYFSEFLDARGVLFRLEILDNVTTSTGFNFSNESPQEFDLGVDGVTIDWSGSGDDLHDPVISSSLTADFLLAGTRHWIFPDVLAGSPEDRFLVALFRFEPTPNSTLQDPDGSFRPEWFGVLSPEGVEYVSNESNEFLRITAHDGLAALNDVPYQDENADPYTTDTTLAGHLGRILEKLPTATLWSFTSGTGTTALPDNNSDPEVYLAREVSYLGPTFTLNAISGVPDAYSVLTSLQAKATAFYEIDTSTDQFGGTFATKTTSTCGQVLKAIVQVLGMRVFQAEGSFWFMNWAALDDRTPYVHSFRSTSHLANRSKTQVGTLGSGFVLDLDAEKLEAIRGLTTRYLFPIHRAVSVHKKGGSTILVSGSGTHTPLGGQDPEVGVYHLTHAAESAAATLQSSLASVLGGDSPVMKGEVRGLPTGQGVTAFDLDAAGMKTLIEMTIKIGDYYLKRNVAAYSANAADYVNIHRTAATDLDYMDLIQSGAVEWTTTPSTYTIVTPFIGQESPEPPVVLQGTNDEIQRVGGYHLELRSNETEFQFTGTTFGDGTLDGRTASFSIDWILPGMPDDVSEHVGVEFSAVVRYYSRTNVEISPADIDALDALNGVAGRIASFKLFSTNDTGEEDVIFVADTNANRAIVKVAETILGDAYTGADSVGALRTWNFTSSTWGSTGADTWRTMDALTGGKYVHEYLAHLAIEERARTLRKISGTFAFDVGQKTAANVTLAATSKKIPSFRKLIEYTIGAAGRKYAAQSMTWSVRATAFDVEGFLVDVDRTISITSDDNKKDVGGGGTSVGGSTPTGGGVAAELYALKSDISTGGNGNGGLSAEDQAKLAAITLDANDQIASIDIAASTKLLTSDQIEDATAFHKFATSGQLTAIATNTSNIATLQSDVSTNTSAIATNTAGIATNWSAIGTLNTTTGTHTTQIAGLQTATSTNASDISTLQTDVSANSTSISSLQTTTSSLSSSLTSLTSQVNTNTGDINTLEGEVNALQAVLKDTTGGGGVGVYTDSSKVTTSSYLGLSSTSARLQAGGNTGIQITETSPGTIALDVQAGATGSEAAVTAVTITGSSTAAAASISMNQRTLFGDGMGFSGGSANFSGATSIIGLSATDLSDVTSAGSGAIITSAERTKLAGIATGAEVNVVTTNLSTADQTIAGTRKINLGTSGVLFVASGTSNAIPAMTITGSATIPAIAFTGSVKMDSGTMAGGSLRLEEFGGGGSSAVTLKAPTYLSADVDFVLPSTDGTSGQALVTDGSGNLSFSTISGGGGSSAYVLASSSTRVPLYWSGRYYFGSTAYGWDTDTGYSYAQTGATSIIDDYAHMGIVAPSAISNLRLFATLRNDDAAEDVEVYVYRGSRPNGSTAAITLTQILTATASCGSGQDLQYNADANTTSAGISAGDLIFVAFRRNGGTNATQNVNASYTLFAS